MHLLIPAGLMLHNIFQYQVLKDTQFGLFPKYYRNIS
jgi:hypothetical protein